MKLLNKLLFFIFSGILISSCSSTESIVQTAILETKPNEQNMTSKDTLTSTAIHTPTNSSTAAITLTPTITFTPTIHPVATITTNTILAPSDTSLSIGEEFKCGDYFIISVLEPPDFASVIEDNPQYYPIGMFMIVKIRIVNKTNSPRWVWFNNYYMQCSINGKLVNYRIDKASVALEILYNTNPYQAEIGPGETYDTMVAFDVHPEGNNWKLVVMPSQLCDVKIPLANN